MCAWLHIIQICAVLCDRTQLLGCKRDCILQERPIILRSLPIVATPHSYHYHSDMCRTVCVTGPTSQTGLESMRGPSYEGPPLKCAKPQRAVASVDTSKSDVGSGKSMPSTPTPPTSTLQQFLDSPFCRLQFWLFLICFALLFPNWFFAFRPDGQISSQPVWNSLVACDTMHSCAQSTLSYVWSDLRMCVTWRDALYAYCLWRCVLYYLFFPPRVPVHVLFSMSFCFVSWSVHSKTQIRPSLLAAWEYIYIYICISDSICVTAPLRARQKSHIVWAHMFIHEHMQT